MHGEYRRPDARTLVRQVHSPYAETTTIDSATGQATIERGRVRRTVALARVPQLAALQASFADLLAGDAAAIERHYRMGSAGTRERWILTLVPFEPTLAAGIRDITLYGRGAELRCIETRPARGNELQRTLLAQAALQAADLGEPAALARLCRTGRSAG